MAAMQGEVRREWLVLYKRCTKSRHPQVTQWRNPTGAPCGLTCQCPWTSLHLLARTKAITCAVRLALNTDTPTATIIITLKEH